MQVASQQECEQAVQSLVDRVADLDPALRRKHAMDRTLSWRVPDLDLGILATLDADGLADLRSGAGAETTAAQIRLTSSSDDLVALLAGNLAAPVAWATGRLRIEASVFDMIRLRTLL
ncbi:MAG: hypothetical protein M4D85_12905 [Actinomycetota bacterium]|nr:hypothetical protein [Actinomycetota bacterium]